MPLIKFSNTYHTGVIGFKYKKRTSIKLKFSFKSQMVGHPGLEPRTFPLKGGCSTNWANDPYNEACVFYKK